jgi:hypothetical protein
MKILIAATAVLAAAVIALAVILFTDTGRFNADIIRLRQQNARLTAQVSGTHRNLITCGDLQTYINSLPQYDSAGDFVGGGSTAGMATLPGHCINR